jgi:subtilisin-like proprotein convertase family protein
MQLRGKPAQGTWKLIVKDTSADDTGTLQSVKLTTTVFAD